MWQNEATWDRVLRVFLGLGLLAFYVLGGHAWWALVGLVPLATGLAGFCPLYRALSFSSRPRSSGA